MNIRRYILSVIMAVLLSVALSSSTSGQSKRRNSSARATVTSFYTFHLAHNTGFTRKSIQQKRKWFAPELYKLMLYEFRREADWVKANPDQVPYLNGDPFTNSQEQPNSYRVDKPVMMGKKAKVDVTFSWTEANAVVDKRTISVVLSRHRGNWVISNIISSDANNRAGDLQAELSRKQYQP